LRATLSSSGDPLQIIVMRKGSESELVSNFTRSAISGSEIQGRALRAPRNGDPMASGRWFRNRASAKWWSASPSRSRYPGARTRQEVSHFGRGDWEVVGIMDSDSERHEQRDLMRT
jgi:hypothetical protein